MFIDYNVKRLEQASIRPWYGNRKKNGKGKKKLNGKAHLAQQHSCIHRRKIFPTSNKKIKLLKKKTELKSQVGTYISYAYNL